MSMHSISSINSIGPASRSGQSPAPAPATGGGIRTQTSPSSAENQAAIFVNQRGGEIKLTFPSDRRAEAENGLRSLEEAVQKENIALNISRDQDTGTIVVKLIDQNSGETVQQIPQEALLRLSAMLGKLQGQLFDRKA